MLCVTCYMCHSMSLLCAVGVHFPSLNSLLSRRVLAVERAFSVSFATSGTHMGYDGVYFNFAFEHSLSSL